jgi:peptidoglycan/xylan/chitin deacetylase (PgdA/CDA1 family)
LDLLGRYFMKSYISDIKVTITKSLREIIGFLLIQLYFFNRKSYHNHVLSIYFHNPCAGLFKKMIKWLRSKGFQFISVDELYSILLNRVPPENKSVVITFDDGWNQNLKLLDFINESEIPITIFIPTQPVLEGNFWWEYAKIREQKKLTGVYDVNEFKHLNYAEFSDKIALLKKQFILERHCITLNELKQLSKSEFITIGSHTVTHPILDLCPYEIQEYELTESRKTLENWLGREVKYFSYPNGNFNKDSIEIAKKCSYRICFTIEQKLVDVFNTDFYTIPRFAMNDLGGYYENLSKLLGIWQKVFGVKE